MISKYTVLQRFIETYGNPIPASTLGKDFPFSVGRNHLQGITTDYETNMKAFITKFYTEQHRIPTMKSIIPISFLSTEHQMFPTDKTLEGLRVLESKPFSHCMIHYFPNELLPLAITRQVEDTTISILLSPYDVPRIHESNLLDHKVRPHKINLWMSGKYKPNWVKQFHAFSSLWLIELENGERLIKCRNPECNTELMIDDYYKTYYNNHPQCLCQCNVWECPMNCYNIRQQRQREQFLRNMSIKKHFWRRKFT